MAHALTWRDIDLDRTLGEGHSGIVYHGRLRRAIARAPAGTEVAVKKYKRSLWDEPGQLERIFRELNTGRAIQHANLVEVFAAVVDDDGRPALVMRYYHGQTLEQTLGELRARSEFWPAASALILLRDMASAICALHTARIIHRDVKPANIILTADGPVLADLGVVRSENFPDQTTTGVFLGTIRYGAPEYIRGEEYDQRVDIYAFGAIAYELFTGRQLYERQQHWARLVAGKSVDDSLSVKASDLVALAARSSIQVARFVQYVVAHSLCKATERDLDLPSFVSAVNAEVWRGSFRTDHGKISAAIPTFQGRFATAEAAADSLKQRLSTTEIAELREVYALRFSRGWASRHIVKRSLIELFAEVGAVEMLPQDWSRIKLVPSVLEAVALDLV